MLWMAWTGDSRVGAVISQTFLSTPRCPKTPALTSREPEDIGWRLTSLPGQAWHKSDIQDSTPCPTSLIEPVSSDITTAPFLIDMPLLCGQHIAAGLRVAPSCLFFMVSCVLSGHDESAARFLLGPCCWWLGIVSHHFWDCSFPAPGAPELWVPKTLTWQGSRFWIANPSFLWETALEAASTASQSECRFSCVFFLFGKCECKTKGTWVNFNIRLELNIFKVRPYNFFPPVESKACHGAQSEIWILWSWGLPLNTAASCVHICQVNVSVLDCRWILEAEAASRICFVFAGTLSEGNATLLQALNQRVFWWSGLFQFNCYRQKEKKSSLIHTV